MRTTYNISMSRRTVLIGIAGLALVPAALAEGLPEINLTKDRSCGSCGAWVEHLRAER